MKRRRELHFFCVMRRKTDLHFLRILRRRRRRNVTAFLLCTEKKGERTFVKETKFKILQCVEKKKKKKKKNQTKKKKRKKTQKIIYARTRAGMRGIVFVNFSLKQK